MYLYDFSGFKIYFFESIYIYDFTELNGKREKRESEMVQKWKERKKEIAR